MGDPAIRFEIGPHNSITVTFLIIREQVIDLIGSFFSQGDEIVKQTFNALVEQGSKDVTLVLTTVQK